MPEVEVDRSIQRAVFLDEPTTGLDPVTRRAVWRTIEEAKQNTVFLHTTHSMDEAEALSQYIGIMAAGQMRCIGTRQRLKSRFGTGYRLQVIHRRADTEATDCLVVFSAPQARVDKREPVPTDSAAIRSSYIVPPGNPISHLYQTMQEAQAAGRVSEFGLAFTSLEEVFLTIAHMVEPPPEGIDMY